MNVLVVDVGNTSAAVAMASSGRVSCLRRLVGPARTQSREIRHVLGRLAGQRRPDGAALSSVVPSATPLWKVELTRLLGVPPRVVSCGLNLGVRLSYPAPRTLGADRLADVCGAFSRYGAPTIVADFGTAATFNVILPRRGFVGGVIAPGPRLMTEYLADRTALLPRIRGAGRWGDVGRSTKGSMLIGARVGYRGMVREIVRHLLSGLRGRRATLVATGGLAREAVAGTDLPFLMDPHLTLYGLSRIFELNR